MSKNGSGELLSYYFLLNSVSDASDEMTDEFRVYPVPVYSSLTYEHNEIAQVNINSAL